ncbi:hypothetical protein, partial [Slackia piriformis]|uniref:hypothetical protein n=1 Tax=Slackia piriformis TaxID=626934 RepID=UPI00294205DA
ADSLGFVQHDSLLFQQPNNAPENKRPCPTALCKTYEGRAAGLPAPVASLRISDEYIVPPTGKKRTNRNG